MDYTDRPIAGQQANSAHDSATPPAGCIDPDRIAPNVAADPRWYGFRWNGKRTPLAYFHFPSADEVTLEPGEPVAIIPARGNGSPLDVAHAALLDGANLDGIAMLALGAKCPELFNGRDGWILWTKESTATEQEKILLLDALGYYDEETHAILIEQGMLPKQPAGHGQDRHATEMHQAATLMASDAYRGTDDANAGLFLELHGQDIRYCPPWEKWLLWTGTHWRIDDRLEIDRLAADIPRALYRQAADARDTADRRQIADLARKLENANKRRSMLIAARHRVVVHHSDLDKGKMLLNVENGTIDLETGELRNHERADLLTHDAEIHYARNATAPTWLRFLEEVFGNDADLINFVQRAVGYSLTGDVREQILLICHGTGSNGKSVFLNILRRLLGCLSWQAAPDLLLQDKHRRHPTEQADLFGKRLVICQETGEGRRFNEELVKQLTGGDAITARRMHEDNWSFEPTHKLWLSTNHKPEIRGSDFAIWRRMRLIPFGVTFREDTDPRKDPTMEDRLLAELPGILAWAVAGCLKWQRDGLRQAEAVKKATESYRAEMDILAAFLAECCVTDRNARVKAGSLYTAYCEWCAQNGEHPEPQRKFGQRLTERGYNREKANSINWWRGFGLQASEEIPISTYSTHSTQKCIKNGAQLVAAQLYTNKGTEGTEGTDNWESGWEEGKL